jgi:hypothetical protein
MTLIHGAVALLMLTCDLTASPDEYRFKEAVWGAVIARDTDEAKADEIVQEAWESFTGSSDEFFCDDTPHLDPERCGLEDER